MNTLKRIATGEKNTPARRAARAELLHTEELATLVRIRDLEGAPELAERRLEISGYLYRLDRLTREQDGVLRVVLVRVARHTDRDTRSRGGALQSLRVRVGVRELDSPSLAARLTVLAHDVETEQLVNGLQPGDLVDVQNIRGHQTFRGARVVERDAWGLLLQTSAGLLSIERRHGSPWAVRRAAR